MRFSFGDTAITELASPPKELHFSPTGQATSVVRVGGQAYVCHVYPLFRCRVVSYRGPDWIDRVETIFFTATTEPDLKNWVPADSNLPWNDHTFGYRFEIDDGTDDWRILVEYEPIPQPAQPVPETRFIGDIDESETRILD